MKQIRSIRLGISVAAIATACAASLSSAWAQQTTLTFVWHAGTCADKFYEISKDYPDKSVKMVPSLVPYGPQWHNKIASEFAIKGDGFDIAMWDSQDAAEFAGGGHAYSINKAFEDSKVLKPELFDRGSLARYGEYPDGSGKFWALPVNQDAFGMIYRKDLFEDPKEKAAFQKKYGRELKVPQTYQDAKQVAEFFTRPGAGLFGWGQMGGRQYDFATSASNGFLWSYGGELWNPKTFEVKGYLNSPASIAGIQAYVDMFKFAPPGSTNWGWDEVNAAFQQGKLAMATNWFYFFGSMADPKTNKYAAQTGFAIPPGAIGQDGKFRRQVSVGGQGMGINIYSKKIPTVVKFMEWYLQPAQQKRYAEVCQTGLKSVIDSPEWQKVNRYNKLFAKAITLTNDYWHLPEYGVLLDQLQEEVSNASSGKKTVTQALNDAAEKNERTLMKAGYKITRTAKIPAVPDQIVTPSGVSKVEELPTSD